MGLSCETYPFSVEKGSWEPNLKECIVWFTFHKRNDYRSIIACSHEIGNFEWIWKNGRWKMKMKKIRTFDNCACSRRSCFKAFTNKIAEYWPRVKSVQKIYGRSLAGDQKFKKKKYHRRLAGESGPNPRSSLTLYQSVRYATKRQNAFFKNVIGPTNFGGEH